MNIEELTPFLYCLATAFIFSIISSVIRSRKHKKALQKSASIMGLSYEGNGTEAAKDLLSLFSAFSFSYVKHILEGKLNGKDIVIGEYIDRRRSRSRGPNQDRYSIVAFYSDSLNTPDFILQPEGFIYRAIEGLVAEKTGQQDIDFPSHPNFSDNYLLKGPNESAIREYFTPKMLKYGSKPRFMYSCHSKCLTLLQKRLSRPPRRS